jgi:hypothetical protein
MTFPQLHGIVLLVEKDMKDSLAPAGNAEQNEKVREGPNH